VGVRQGAKDARDAAVKLGRTMVGAFTKPKAQMMKWKSRHGREVSAHLHKADHLGPSYHPLRDDPAYHAEPSKKKTTAKATDLSLVQKDRHQDQTSSKGLDGLTKSVAEAGLAVAKATGNAVREGRVLDGAFTKPKAERKEWTSRHGTHVEKGLRRIDHLGHAMKGGFDDGASGARGGEATATRPKHKHHKKKKNKKKKNKKKGPKGFLIQASYASALMYGSAAHHSTGYGSGTGSAAYSSAPFHLDSQKEATAKAAPQIVDEADKVVGVDSTPAAQTKAWKKSEDTSPHFAPNPVVEDRVPPATSVPATPVSAVTAAAPPAVTTPPEASVHASPDRAEEYLAALTDEALFEELP